MVDFRKLLSEPESTKPVDPVSIYDTLDRESDKGPLRPAQRHVLSEWFSKRSLEKDLILKLHTGQGKTLIGLLILQSKLNSLGEPVLYLCANNFLVNQTCAQARSFGVNVCTADSDIPVEFYEGKSILVTSVHKLFNGKTKFGLGPKSAKASTIVIDDAHTCIDTIRASFQITLDRSDTAYSQLLNIFAEALEAQGAGTFADIQNKKQDALLAVPYWDWRDKTKEVVHYLSKSSESDNVKFAWPLIKDIIPECQCIISGTHLEISPYLPPLREFGTYENAEHRVFMSATVADDSFLIKGLTLSPETIRTPLVWDKERWSGERMILIPSLVDESLDRSTIVKELAPPQPGRTFGVVALARSFRSTMDWERYKATIAKSDSIDDEIAKLRKGKCEQTLVLVNRYDGVDLPDSTCRILIFDSMPISESLVDRYEESCRASSQVTAIRLARAIEQGLGRSVRGERDYCVVILVGADLVKTVRMTQHRAYFSNQTREQIEIGLQLAEVAKGDMVNGHGAIDVVKQLIQQCLQRDADWKAFYTSKMEKIQPDNVGETVLELFETELEAERSFFAGKVDQAVGLLQALANDSSLTVQDQAWYKQEMARFQFVQSEAESEKLQRAAHKLNHYLLRPRTGLVVTKLQAMGHKRLERLRDWVVQFDTFENLSLAVEDFLDRLTLGVDSERFESALDSLGKALGFKCERPDKEWKTGPDNLWALKDDHYMLFECKSEVKATRAAILGSEAAQMNASCAWFDKTYKGGASCRNIMIIPTYKVESGADFTHDVVIMTKKPLGQFKAKVKGFFNEFRKADLKDLSDDKIHEWLSTHALSVEELLSKYGRSPHFLN